MDTESPDSSSSELTDSMVCAMVDVLEPDWHVDSVERVPHGTDFVAVLDVRSPTGNPRVVLKATTADFVDSVVASAEPRLLELVGRETTIPVPTVFGYCDDHEEYPTPFYLMSYVDGENYENDAESLSFDARKTILREAGENLAELHELGPLDAAGKVGVEGGALTVLDTDEHPQFDDFREKLLAECEETLDSLTDGGFFPSLADDPTRFADLVPELRAYLRDEIPALPVPEQPTYCHWDYRLGNLLIDPTTGSTQAVLDWANLSATDPANNLAQTEFYLLTPEADGPERTAALRESFRRAYVDTRDSWSFDDSTRERMDVYSLACRLGAMACLPLWYRDASAEERDERATEHRAFVSRYIS